MLMWLWQLIIGGCDHKWKIYQTATINPRDKKDSVIGEVIILQCEKCGNIKEEHVWI